MRTIKATVYALLAAAACGGAVAQTNTAKANVDIKPQPFRLALKDLGEQTGLQIVFRVEDVAAEGRNAPRVSGELSAIEALEKLLSKSSLTYQFVNPTTVLISSTKAVAEKTALSMQAGEHEGPLVLAESRPGAGEAVATEETTRGGNDPISKEPLQEVLVTAQKRTERLLDVPQSVSVLSADELSKLGATQFRDFADTVPGLTFQTAGAGLTNVTLRGVTTGFDRGRKVATYFDDVPYGSSSIFTEDDHTTVDAGLFDIDRIEVLRGPQGTLYGAASEGGLIKYVTKLPDVARFGGAVQAGVSNTESGTMNYNVAGVVNVPLVTDKLAMRLSGFQTHEGGYADNITLGKKNVDRSNNHGGRLDVLYVPTEKLKIRINGYAQDVSRDGFAVALFNLNGTPVNGDLIQQRHFEEPFHQKFRLASGSATYDMEWASITSISGYQTTETQYFFDYTSSFLPTLQAIPATANRYSAVGVPDRTSTDKFTQEVRLASHTNDTLEWLIGGFYTHETSSYRQEFALRDLAGQPVANTLFTYYVPTKYEETAGFANATWHITEKFDMAGGVRHAEDRQSFQQIGTGLFGASKPLTKSTGNNTTYLANARYKFTDQASGYLRFATGYRPGGPNYVTVNPTTGLPNGLPTFGPEQLKSYEIGFKADVLDGRFGYDLAGYVTTWSDMQIGVRVNGFASSGNSTADAHIRGAEMVLTARPIDALRLTANGAYQHAVMAGADPNMKASEGERLPNVPRVTGAVSADYELSVGTAKPAIGATVRYVGDRYTDFRSSTSFPYYHLPAYTLTDVRMSMTLGSVDAQIFVRNVFDERAQLNSRTVLSPISGPVEIAILQPRTFGVRASMKF